MVRKKKHEEKNLPTGRGPNDVHHHLSPVPVCHCFSLFPVVSSSWCLPHHPFSQGWQSVPSLGAVQCNNYKLRIKIEYISYITEPKKRYLNQMMMDVIWAHFLHDVASQSVEGMQVASLQPQDLPLDWVTRDLW